MGMSKSRTLFLAALASMFFQQGTVIQASQAKDKQSCTLKERLYFGCRDGRFPVICDATTIWLGCLKYAARRYDSVRSNIRSTADTAFSGCEFVRYNELKKVHGAKRAGAIISTSDKQSLLKIALAAVERHRRKSYEFLYCYSRAPGGPR